MKRMLLIVVLGATLLLPLGCGDNEDQAGQETTQLTPETPPGPGQVQPPVPYQVGETKPTPGVTRGVAMDIVVQPGVTSAQLEELFLWFEQVWYSDRKLIQVDVYDDMAAASSLNFDADRVLATFRFTAPNHRDVKIYDERLLAAQRESGVPSDRVGTHAVYLGPRSRMFGSQEQAQYLKRMVEEKPNKRIYELSWLSNESKIVLSYDAVELMLVRVREGFNREVWQNFTLEQLDQAAMGSGFGGSTTYGADYLRLDESQGGVLPVDPSTTGQ